MVFLFFFSSLFFAIYIFGELLLCLWIDCLSSFTASFQPNRRSSPKIYYPEWSQDKSLLSFASFLWRAKKRRGGFDKKVGTLLNPDSLPFVLFLICDICVICGSKKIISLDSSKRKYLLQSYLPSQFACCHFRQQRTDRFDAPEPLSLD